MMKKKLSLFLLPFLFSPFPAFANGGYAANQEAFDAVNLSAAYEAGFTGKGVMVGVFDSGSHEGHKAFEIIADSGETSAKVVSDTSAGEFDTEHAFNRILWPTSPEDSPLYPAEVKNMKHGTHVAGIITAAKDGVMQGVAYGSRVAAYTTIGINQSAFPTIFNSLNTTFPAVKIINASWGFTVAPSDEVINALATFFSSDHLLVAAAGNDRAENPSLPAYLPQSHPEALGVINVVAFSPFQEQSSPTFFANYSNLAGTAANWTIAAPGSIYSATLDPTDHDDMESYEMLEGTSMATPVVSGTAALVQEAFPFLTGKQIADVLLTTASNDFSDFSPYILQEVEDTKQYIIFTDVVESEAEDGTITYKDPEAIIADAGIDCVENTCLQKKYAEVYGRGILNAGKAVKGLGALDATRLTEDEKDADLSQYLYPVSVGTYTRTNAEGQEEEYIPIFSNNIGEIRNTTNPDYGVGLKKTGAGELILSGQNTYTGDTVVSAGKLTLKGLLSGRVRTDEGGTFTLTGGTIKGNVINEGAFVMNSGTVVANASVDNLGIFTIKGGTIAGTMTNASELVMSGGAFSNPVQNAEEGTVKYYSGSAPKIVNEGTIDNYGVIAVSNFIEGGNIVNHQGAKIATSFTADTFLNNGYLLLKANGAGEVESVTVTGEASLASGGFAIMDDTIYRRGSYIVLTGGSLQIGEDFSTELKISENTKLTAMQDGNSLLLEIVYSNVGENMVLSKEESAVASIFNEMFIHQDKNDFAGYYYYSEDMLRKKINELRDQIQPQDIKALPLTGHLTENVGARLSALREGAADMGTYRNRYSPPETYRGKYARGRSGGDEKTTSKVWGQIVGGRGRFNASEKTARGKARMKAAGVQFGWDTEVGDNSFFGVTAGFARSETNQSGDEIDVNDWRGGLYYGFSAGRVSVNATAIGGLQEYHSRRMTKIVGMTAVNKASYKGYSAEGGLNIGYDIMKIPRRSYSFGLRPYIAADVSYVKQDAYRENGQNQNFLLSVSESDDTSASAQAGVQLSYRWSDAQLTLDAGYRRLLKGGDPVSTAYFIADTTQTKFKSLAETPDKNYLSLGIGIESNFTQNTRFALRADQKRSENNVISMFSATWSYSF